MDIILLIFRLVVGLGIATQGVEKLFGWFAYGVEGSAHLETVGPLPRSRLTAMAGLGEFAAGVLLALGLMNPIGSALMLSVVMMAIFRVHRVHGFFNLSDGTELPIFYLAGTLLIAFGPGRYSLDHMLGLELAIPRVALWIVLAVGGLGALGNLVRRAPPEPPVEPSVTTSSDVLEIFEGLQTAERVLPNGAEFNRYCFVVEFRGVPVIPRESHPVSCTGFLNHYSEQ